MAHFYAWVCDCCHRDVHTPMSRADPPNDWRTVVTYGEADDTAVEHHYCSSMCAANGPLPVEVAASLRDDDDARAVDAGRGTT